MKKILCASVAIGALAIARGAAADDTAPAGGTIGYIVSSMYWGVHQSADGKAECPKGLNEGPREHFKALFPADGTKRPVAETQLKREAEGYFPTLSEEPFTFHLSQSKIAKGLNLDGKVDADDFLSADGEKGIDNQLFRVLGCVRGYRAPDGDAYFFDNNTLVNDRYNRWLFELTNVDSLVNDDDVTVTTYRGLDTMLKKADGNGMLAGGSQVVDVKWGARYVHTLKGRIKDGVLTTDPKDVTFPWATFGIPTDREMREMRMRVNLTPTGGAGLIGGYTVLENWYRQTLRSSSTHHQAYGDVSLPSVYRALRRAADGHPDPKTGENTTLSSALDVTLTQVHIIHPDHPVAAAEGATSTAAAAKERAGARR
ncbi:MAG: hypothetical protein AB7E79_16300 [Rhodospirillaceae bacterium]